MFEKFLHQTPFFRLLIPLLTGVLFQINFPYLNTNSLTCIILIVFILSSLFSVFKLSRKYVLNKIWGIVISILLFFIGNQLVSLKQASVFHFNNQEYTFIGTVIEEPQEKENSVKTELKLVLYKDSNQHFTNHSQILCYLQKDSISLNLHYGDQILASAYINDIKHHGNPYAFNFKKFLKYQEIYNQCYIKSNNYKIINHDQGSKVWLLSHKTRQKLLRIYQENNITGNEFAVLSALTLGYKAELTPELKESFSTSGAMHILAVSGLHVGIIFIILSKILFFLQRSKYGKIIQSSVIIIVLFFYAFLTGLSDSVLRATIMFTFIAIGRMFTRQINIYNSISASAFILLIINPYSIMNVGFQLSYAAVLSIVFFQPKIYSLIPVNNRILDYLWQLISVAIAAQLGTFPITIFYFDQFPLYFILSNIIIIPLATIIIYGAILMFILSFSDFLSLYISKALNFTTVLLNRNVNFIENLPFSKLDQILIDQYEVFILLIIIIITAFFIISKKIRFLKITLILSIFYLIYNISSTYVNSKKCMLTVHHVAGLSAIHIVEKNSALLYHTNDIDLNENGIKYNISPIWKTLEIKPSNISFQALNKPLNYIQIQDKRIIHIQSDSIELFKPEFKLKINYLILSNNINIDVKSLSQFFEYDRIIFDSSNSFYHVKNWENECKQNNIAFYNVLNDGAFIRYL